MGFYGANSCGFAGMFGFGGPIVMGIIIIAVIAGAVWMIAGKRNSRTNHTGSNAFEILQERLAKGEITPEEFRLLKKELE